MSEIYEHQYLVFSVRDGPKVINESLNTYGAEGWELCSLLPVAGVKLCAYLKRALNEKPPETKDDEKKKELLNLWSDKT